MIKFRAKRRRIPNVSPVQNTHGSCWALVLAGGEGTRMQPFVQRLVGEKRPMQYCTFVGSRSMLQHTLDRARALVPEDHIVTLIGSNHSSYLHGKGVAENPGCVLKQPKDCGTAVAVFVGLAYIFKHDPRAIVTILPSDHFIWPESRFKALLKESCEIVERSDGKIVLLGATPTSPDSDYGWIQPSTLQEERSTQSRNPTPLLVRSFHEKPPRDLAESLFRQGCLWNTMIVTSRLKTLWDLGREHLPQVLHRVEGFRIMPHAVEGLGRCGRLEDFVLRYVFDGMPQADFSWDLLQEAAGEKLTVLPMHDVVWSDWGSPDRVVKSLRRIGMRPALLQPNGRNHRRAGMHSDAGDLAYALNL